MLETKIILALTVKNFDFVAEFEDGPIHSVAPIETVDELPAQAERRDKGEIVPRTLEGHFPGQILLGAAKPRDAMPGRMYLRGEAS